MTTIPSSIVPEVDSQQVVCMHRFDYISSACALFGSTDLCVALIKLKMFCRVQLRWQNNLNLFFNSDRRTRLYVSWYWNTSFPFCVTNWNKSIQSLKWAGGDTPCWKIDKLNCIENTCLGWPFPRESPDSSEDSALKAQMVIWCGLLCLDRVRISHFRTSMTDQWPTCPGVLTKNTRCRLHRPPAE